MLVSPLEIANFLKCLKKGESTTFNACEPAMLEAMPRLVRQISDKSNKFKLKRQGNSITITAVP